ncbi:MAG: hypothetical protein ABW321_32600 [Polyangiales bacterium]
MSGGKQPEPLGVYDDGERVCRPITRWERETNPSWLGVGAANDPGLAPYTPGPLGFDDHAERRNLGLDQLALARGFMFVVIEQLPEVGAGSKIIRKVALLPRDFSLAPRNPSGVITLAEHALGGFDELSQFLSASDRPIGAPSIQGKPVLIDLVKVKAAGGYVHSVEEVLADLRRFAEANPQARARVEKLMWAIDKVEGEVLIEGGVPGKAVQVPGPAHLGHIRSGEALWRDFTKGALSKAELEAELVALQKAYGRAQVVGRVGRVLSVVGVVMTAVDLTRAAQRSREQHSFKPVGAEVLRQVGGWGGALAGAKIGFAGGALFGIETGPGALITGGIGALIFGGLGYFGADLVADQISPN